MSAEAIAVDAQAARRFVLGRQGLWPGRRGAGKAGTRDTVVACEHLQLDPLVIVARSHELMLHSRVAGFQPELFDALGVRRPVVLRLGWLAGGPADGRAAVLAHTHASQP